MNDQDAKAGGHGGLRKHYVFTQVSRVFDLDGPVSLNCFYLDKDMINGVNVQLRMFRSRNEFTVISKEASANYQVTIQLDAV